MSAITNKYLFLSAFLLGYAGLLMGQDQTLQLDSIVVKDSPIKTPASQIWTESQTESTSLDELLKTSSLVYLKEYGLGTLSTISIRGSNSGQTRILWNGIMIDDALTGSTDLSAMKLADFDRISLETNNTSTVGAIGGSIEMNDRLASTDTTRLKINYRYGSWHYSDIRSAYQYRTQSYMSKTSAIYNQTSNNYPYSLTNGDTRIQSHARQRNYGLKHSSLWQLSNTGKVEVHYWFSHLNRLLPPKTTQLRSLASKEDKSHRLLARHTFFKKNQSWKTSAAYFYNSNLYNDSLTLTYADNTYGQLVIKEEYDRYGQKNNRLNLSAEFRQTDVLSSGGIELDNAIRDFIIAGRYEWAKKNNKLIFGIENQIRGEFSPLLAMMHWSHSFNNDLILQTTLSKNFRRPALNDLYWKPGGNPKLLPEKAYLGEVTLSYKNLRFSTYYKAVEDWILWKKEDEAFFFSASNIDSVISYGVDIEYRYRYILNTKWQNHFSLLGQYNRTYSVTDVASIGIVKNRQLAYTPEYKFAFSYDLNYDNLGLLYRHIWNGKVYTEYEGLPSFHIGYIELDYHFLFRKFPFTFQFKIDNLWNENYRVVEREAMPGRSFYIGAKVTL